MLVDLKCFSIQQITVFFSKYIVTNIEDDEEIDEGISKVWINGSFISSFERPITVIDVSVESCGCCKVIGSSVLLNRSISHDTELNPKWLTNPKDESPSRIVERLVWDTLPWPVEAYRSLRFHLDLEFVQNGFDKIEINELYRGAIGYKFKVIFSTNKRKIRYKFDLNIIDYKRSSPECRKLLDQFRIDK